MFGIKDLSVDFLVGLPLLVAGVFALLIMLSVFLYYRTNPPLPRYLRIILGILRICAVAVVFLAISQPVVSFTRQFERPLLVTLLRDHSASMNRVEEGMTRGARLDSLLSTERYARFSNQVEEATLYFGGNVAADTETIDRDKTALGDALETVSRQQITRPADQWILLSDGRSNSGRNAAEVARQLKLPVTTVDLSGGSGSPEISITEANYNPVFFAGQPGEVEVKLAWRGAPPTRVTARLSDSARTVDETWFDIEQSEGLGRVTLQYLPERPGQRFLKVSISALDGEEDTDNNRRSFSVKVLKSRLQILLVTDRPDHEVGFLKRLLELSEKYDVTLLVGGSKAGNLAGRFPSTQSEINQFDLIILHDPDPDRLEPRRDIIQAYLADRGGALWVFYGGQFARSSARWFDEFLPFYHTQRRQVEYFSFRAEPSEGHLFHPSVRLADDRIGIRKFWSELPPFEGLVRCDRIEPEATVLAVVAGGDPAMPVLGYKRIGPGKVIACAAMPFWPWGFVSLGFGDDDAGYAKFVEGTVGWLTLSDDLEPIRIRPEKEVFTRNETIRFDGYAFDLGFRPLTGVTGTVRLESTDGDRIYEADMTRLQEGSYRAYLYNVVPGDYAYRATLSKDDRLLKETVGKILVESFSLEEYDQGGDPATLKAVSRLTGGAYYTYDKFDQVLDSIDTSPLSITRKSEFVLRDQFWLLLAFILALSLEWLIRKVHQLL